MNRPRFTLSTAATLATGPMLGVRGSDAATRRYDDAVQRTWRHASPLPDAGSAKPQDLQHELVRYATLAPSSHNTQCWKFRLDDQAITILPDLSRRCPAVDPDDHHLFVSLGCAAENLIQAAQAFGLQARASFDAAGDAVRVALRPAAAVRTPLFDAIPERQCTRGDYDGQPLAAAELALLEQAAAGPGVRAMLITGAAGLAPVLEAIVRANTAQIEDQAFVDELKRWVRFNPEAASSQCDGLFAGLSGNPSIPSWLGRLIFGLLLRPGRENEKIARQVRSSAGFAVFVSERDDKAHWVEAGRSYQRFALQATALGVRNAFLNQPVEVAEQRPAFAAQLGLATGLETPRPDLVVRFGRGPAMPRSLRRPVEAVLI